MKRAWQIGLAWAAVVAGLLIDGSFIGELVRGLTGTMPEVGVGFSLAAHGVAGLLAGFGLAALLPRASCSGWCRVFFVASAIFVPVLGIVGPLIAVIGALHLPKPAKDFDVMQSIHPPELPERGSDNPMRPRLGPASAYGRLRHGREVSERMGAVMAVRTISGRSAVPVLKLALHDGADEVRLLAFTILQERERLLYAQIHELQGKIAGASQAEVGALSASLAQSYWELAYQDLVQGELLAFALEKAAKHLSDALTSQPNNSGYTLLLGRIRLRQGRGQEAAQILARAAQLGMADQIVKVHQAEAAFVERRFDEVRACLAAIPSQGRSRALVKELVEYWT